MAGALGARTTLVAAGVLGGLVTISFLFLPGMRSVEEDPAADQVGSDLTGTFGLPHPADTTT